ncbi:hypothetical protein [Streptomyces olindensis]|uniref:hypothetical protein n=1 Tax=Streptomyces olindensis TaxID=358823 RepID=UPI00364DCAB8
MLHAALALAQPVSAGSYLSGDFDILATHSSIGLLLLAATAVWGAAALAHVVANRGAGWPLILFLPVVFMAEGVQIGMGHQRNLAVHIPLGVLIVLTAVLLTAWSFTSWARPKRRMRRVAPGEAR